MPSELNVAHVEPGDFVIDRNGIAAKAFMTLLVGTGAAFSLSMAVLVSHHSSLSCAADLNCTHIETYPFEIEMTRALVKISSAEPQWDPVGRRMAMKLALTHTDGSTTEYQGVGKNGERAQKTAAAINAFIKHPTAPQTFALREGSVGTAIFMAMVGLLALCIVPYFFSKIRLQAHGGVLTASIERRPLSPRRFRFPLQRVAGFNLYRSVMLDQEFFKVTLDLNDGEPVDIGLAFRSVEQAHQRLSGMNAWLEQRRPGPQPRLGSPTGLSKLHIRPDQSHDLRTPKVWPQVTPHFEIVEARWLGLGGGTPPQPQWLLSGRAYVDVMVGDTFEFGTGNVTVEGIRTYGKEVEVLDRMHTGELTVRWVGDEFALFLSR